MATSAAGMLSSFSIEMVRLVDRRVRLISISKGNYVSKCRRRSDHFLFGFFTYRILTGFVSVSTASSKVALTRMSASSSAFVGW